VLSVFRAILNYAWREGRAPSADAWRRIKPFHAAGAPRIRYLEQDEARRLVNACDEPLRALVRAGLLTGCRYGELTQMRVEDYRADAGTLYVRESKSGKPRHVPLNAEGVALFEELSAGRPAGEPIFLRAGAPWAKNAQVRDLARACARAAITPAISFHVLRHTYGSWLAMQGVALQVISEVLGHSDTRVTQRHYAHLAPSHVAQIVREKLPVIAPARAKVQKLALRKRAPSR
jgi:integrase